MVPELWLGYDQHLEGDEGHLQEQEAAHKEARVSKQVPVPAVVQTVDITSLTKAWTSFGKQSSLTWCD